jgi:hypothetical protein
MQPHRRPPTQIKKAEKQKKGGSTGEHVPMKKNGEAGTP